MVVAMQLPPLFLIYVMQSGTKTLFHDNYIKIYEIRVFCRRVDHIQISPTNKQSNDIRLFCVELKPR